MPSVPQKLVLEWEANLDSLPEEVKRTSKGKSDYVTMVQCKDDLQALFKLLRKRVPYLPFSLI